MFVQRTAAASSRFAASVPKLTSRIGGSRRMAASAVTSSLAPSSFLHIPSLGSQDRLKFGRMGTTALVLSLGLAAQYKFGSSEDFFDHQFSTTKNPSDLADFYGTEDFMEVFCVLPFMVNFMMRQATFDEEGNIHALGISGPGRLEVKIDFEEESDTTGDWEPDTITYFNKRESFRDVLPEWLGGFTLWEMTQNFGYRLTDNGVCVVSHHGEHFQGFFPIRFIFQLHARYVIWATQKYINGPEFGASSDDSDDATDRAEEIRHNIPLHEFKLFLSDLTRQLVEAAALNKEGSGDEKKQKQLEATIQRLRTLSKHVTDHHEKMGTLHPRLTTLRSRKTHRISSVHLRVDDDEARDTIRTALEQIGSEKRQQPVAAMRALSHRTTIARNKTQTSSNEK